MVTENVARMSSFTRVETWTLLLNRGRKVLLPNISLSLKLCWLGLGCKPMPKSVNSKGNGISCLEPIILNGGDGLE